MDEATKQELDALMNVKREDYDRDSECQRDFDLKVQPLFDRLMQYASSRYDERFPNLFFHIMDMHDLCYDFTDSMPSFLDCSRMMLRMLPTAQHPNPETVLEYVCRTRHMPYLYILMYVGSNEECRDLLTQAINQSWYYGVEAILISVPRCLEKQSNIQATKALGVAIMSIGDNFDQYYEQLRIVEILLQQHGDPNGKDYGCSFIMHVMTKRSVECLEMLVKYGLRIDENIPNLDYPPIRAALHRNWIEGIISLANAGANINIRGMWDETFAKRVIVLLKEDPRAVTRILITLLHNGLDTDGGQDSQNSTFAEAVTKWVQEPFRSAILNIVEERDVLLKQ